MRLPRRSREREDGPGPVRYSVDELSADRALGWAFAPGREVSVRVVVAGTVVGEATTGGYRVDVAQSLGLPDAARSGFEFPFGPDHFAHVGDSRAVVLMLSAGADTVETDPVAVPVFAAEPAAAGIGSAPLPPGVVALLHRFRPGTYDRPWDDELAERAVTDLRFLLQRGPRAVPALHRHLVLLGQLWLRAAFVERYSPGRTRQRTRAPRTVRPYRTPRWRCTRWRPSPGTASSASCPRRP